MPPALVREQLRDGRGRCALAAQRVAAGTCVLQTRALAAISVTSCNWCFASASASGGGSARLSRCGGCRRLRYCSAACQRRDWIDGGHARECGAWKRIPASVRDAALQTVLLVARLVAAGAHKQPEVAQLRAHYEEHAEAKLQQFREMALLVRSLLPAVDYPTDDALLRDTVQLLCRVNCNAFTISDDACAPVGIGVFPHGALFNHSCAPNCVVSFAGQDMRVRAIADVAPDDELTISYVELLETTATRQQALRESYFFDCDCARCATATTGANDDDWFLDGHTCPSSGAAACGTEGVVVFCDGASVASCKRCGVVRSLPNRKALEHAREDLATRLRAHPPGPDKWRLCQQQRALLVDELALHPRNARLAAFYRDAGTWLVDAPPTAFPSRSFRATTALAMFSRELAATAWLLPATKLPARGLLHFQIGKLQFEAARDSDSGRRDRAALEAATDHLQRALSILSCAYGPDNALVSRVYTYLEEVARAARDD
ncbi:hypothetical protein PybrP1_004943 [[Pythium] brassicae (nom. inval.)]|nr:hypothetical protein PybrP1_004943 [[Pythium] brassicae (nom. inval.)]